MAKSIIFAKRVFQIAGILGIVFLLPQYFMETQFGIQNPPAITHPEFYYGFTGVALAFQFLFLILAKDPVRYKPMMLPSIAEKALFASALAVLLATGRAPVSMFAALGFDTLCVIMFALAYFKTPDNIDSSN